MADYSRALGKIDPIQISVPVTDWSTGTLLHRIISTDTVFSENRLGIPEPVSAPSLTDLNQIGAVLVPLLAFDRQGHRVGYGGGYYDRFLAECRPDCQKVGLSLFEPVDQIDDIEPTDVRLDAFVTASQVWLFS